MRRKRVQLWTVAVTVAGLAGLSYAASLRKGWVTHVDAGAQTIQVGDQTVSTQGMRITEGKLEPGVFVEITRGEIEVQQERLPVGDTMRRFPVRTSDNPGRVEFSHLRHANALGNRQCQICHAADMRLVTGPGYAGQTAHTAQEAHSPQSLGRYCATCHNGVTQLSQVGTLHGRRDIRIFTAFKTADAGVCQRCHAPADHGRDFSNTHGDVAHKQGRQACLGCHAQDWRSRDRKMQRDLLAAEQTLRTNADDERAARVVGPNNFCVYCHRADPEWLER